MRENTTDYAAWEQSVSHAITDDALWKLEVYRLALFVADSGWQDVTKLAQDRRTFLVSDQLHRSLGSIAANIAEGFSRGSHKDRVRFYEYALGSARESRGWYYRVRRVLGEKIVEQRFSLLNQIIRLLLRMIPEQRGYAVREVGLTYSPERKSALE